MGRESPSQSAYSIITREIAYSRSVDREGKSHKGALRTQNGVPQKDLVETTTIILRPINPRIAAADFDFQDAQDELAKRLQEKGLPLRRPHTHGFEPQGDGRVKIGRISIVEEVGEIVYTISSQLENRTPHFLETPEDIYVRNRHLSFPQKTTRKLSREINIRLYPAEIAAEVLACQLARDRGFLGSLTDKLLETIDMNNLDHTRRVLRATVERLPAAATLL